ncbi:MAG: thioredoxin family protein [Planctomycetes bacterium]|nr:thioredoxin family protein [Planctomycetota bacterium]
MILANLLLFALLLPGRGTGEVFRQISLEAAQAAAKAEGRCVLAEFASPGAADTKKLATTTWSESRVREWVVLKSVPIKLDFDKSSELLARLRVHVAPTIMFLDESGRELDRITGYVDGRTFLAETKAIFGGASPLERAQTRLAEDDDDPHRHLDVAMLLADNGQLAESLKEFLWCWDHGAVVDTSFAECRRTFLLRELLRLMRLYPPAGDALLARTRAGFQRVVSCTVTEAELADFLLLNHEMQRDEHTLAAYDALDVGNEPCAALRTRLGPLVVNPMIDSRRYADAAALIGDVRARFNGMVTKFRAECARLEKEYPPAEAFVLIENARRLLRIDSARLYETFLGTELFDDAEAFSKQVLAFDAKGATYCALMRGALRAQAHGPAKSIANRALRDPKLTASEKEDVKQIAAGILQPK